VPIEEWYMKNVVVYGAIGSPIVATLLVERVVGDRFRIAPLLAKVFHPLVPADCCGLPARHGHYRKKPIHGQGLS